jgi:hypothetical protein
MRFRSILIVAVVLLMALPFALGKDKKNKKTVPAVFSTARYGMCFTAWKMLSSSKSVSRWAVLM